MLFNSLIYIAFFLAVYLIYRAAPHCFQNLVLLAASYIFHAWWESRYLCLVTFYGADVDIAAFQ